MRMRQIMSAFVGILLSAVALNGFAQSSAAPAAPAAPAPSPAKPPPPKPPVPSRAPIGAPPALNGGDINQSYEFRNRMSSDPACQELARQSDSVYANDKMESDKKQSELQQIQRRAAAAGCL